MIKKYCCLNFQIHNTFENSFGLNIRIAKASKQFMDRSNASGFPLDNPISFYLTEGYQGTLNDNLNLNMKRMVIWYCPSCGTKLHDFYKSDEYVQEIVEP